MYGIGEMGRDTFNSPQTKQMFTIIVSDRAVLESFGSLDEVKAIATVGFAARYHIKQPGGIRLKWIPVAWDEYENPVLWWAKNTDVRISVSEVEVK